MEGILNSRGHYFALKHNNLITFGSASSLFGLLFCLLWSVLYNFDDVNDTHCKVANIIPSISSCMGNSNPQGYVWRICVAVMLGQRLVDTLGYYSYLSVGYFTLPLYHWSKKGPVSKEPFLRRLNVLNFYLMLIENAALVLLTYISSTENHNIHVGGFTLFIISSQCNMALTTYLYVESKSQVWLLEDIRSYRWKIRCFKTNIATMSLACYLFYRHNTYCEPYVYSLFSSCEWIVVLSNIAFHYSAAFDFQGCVLVFGPVHYQWVA